MEIRRVGRDDVRPLQQAVLRPDGPLPWDRPLPTEWTHLAAYESDRIVGVASLGPRAWQRPDLVELPEPVWQLRSMAVVPELQGSGIGSALLTAAVEQARAAGIAAVWAEARVAALALYVRAGWSVVGEEWEKPGVGPHRYVWTALTQGSA